MLLTNASTDEMYKIITNISLEICKKNMFCQEDSKETPKKQRQKGYDEKKIKISKEIQRATNHQPKINIL